MIKQLVTWCTKIQEFESNFHLSADTPIEIAEQMALQFITYLGNVKAQSKAQADAVEAAKVLEPVAVEDQPEAPKE